MRDARQAGTELATALKTTDTPNQITNPSGSNVKSNPLRNIMLINESPTNLLTGHANNPAMAQLNAAVTTRDGPVIPPAGLAGRIA
jgi:hypothetical protein